MAAATMLEFRITRKENKTKRINKSIHRYFRDLLGRFPLDTALKKRVVKYNEKVYKSWKQGHVAHKHIVSSLVLGLEKSKSIWI